MKGTKHLPPSLFLTMCLWFHIAQEVEAQCLYSCSGPCSGSPLGWVLPGFLRVWSMNLPFSGIGSQIFSKVGRPKQNHLATLLNSSSITYIKVGLSPLLENCRKLTLFLCSTQWNPKQRKEVVSKDNLLCTNPLVGNYQSVRQGSITLHCVGRSLGKPHISQDQKNRRQNLNMLFPPECILSACLLVGWRKPGKNAQLVSKKGDSFSRH